MNRPVFGKKSSRTQGLRVDRFMPPREVFADQRRRRSNTFDADTTFKIWDGNYQKQKNYKNYLDEAFGIESTRKVETRRDLLSNVQPWPCAPRKQAYLSSADSILDLPSYSSSPFSDLLDWGNSNMLVAALGYSYHMYSWEKQMVTGSGITSYPITCCKFDPTGDILTIGTESDVVEVHDSATNKLLNFYKCNDAVTAIDWSPTGNSFIIGSSNGYVAAFDHRMQNLISWQCISSEANLVQTVKISPDTRFVAAVVLNSFTVKFLEWPSLEICFSLRTNGHVQTISWHPWRSALLGFGVITQNGQTNVALCDTPSSKTRECKIGIYDKYIYLDMMLFSKKSGELVLSLWRSAHRKTSSQLVVMRDPYTVVDLSGDCKLGLDRVRTMVFSPDGTKLATATMDEDLVIWNFLPEDKIKKNTKQRRFSAIPEYLDEVTFGYVVR